MSHRNLYDDEDAILGALNQSDLDVSSDEDYVPPSAEVPESSESDDDVVQPRAVIPPRSSAVWKKGRFLSKPLPSLHADQEVIQVLTPAQYFERYITENIYEIFALNTNVYYQTTKNMELKPLVTAAEIKAFFGINGILSCIKYPRLKMAWQARFKLDCVADTMKRDRFFTLRTNLHIVDKASVTQAEKQQNRLWIVQPLIDTVRNRCLELPRTKCTYSIDEQMVPFLGKCPIKQYVANKPRPVGLKNFVVTTSAGLVLDFEIYQGDTTPFPDRSIGLGPAVVLRLIKTLPRGSFVYFDRYFTTLPLLQKMLTEGIEGTGTLQNNRFKGYTFKKDSTMKRGDYEEITNNEKDICLIKWKDSKAILMASTATGAQPIESVERWDKKQKKYINIPCPSMFKKYNENMGGVDICDQMMEVYRSWHKTKKWTLKLIMHLFDMANVNLWFEYRLDCEEFKTNPMDFLEFKLCIADYLMGSPTRKRTRDVLEEMGEFPLSDEYKVVAIPTIDKRLDGYNHWPVVDSIKAPRCCRVKGCTSRSRVRCTKCNVYLCSTKNKNCFFDFHNK